MTCVFCLASNELRDEQVLLRGEHLYLCAPRGQFIEGYLAITPYDCIGSLSRLPVNYFEELARIRNAAIDFYVKSYGTTQVTLYEQGRAGGGATVDHEGGFPLHAHLCCLPLSVDLHAVLAPDFSPMIVSGPHDLPLIARNKPYVYVESMDEKVVYFARSDEGCRELERKRLKPTIASLLGVPERGYWRTYPGDRELGQLIKRWRNICPS